LCKVDAVTLFEVFEHFVDPIKEVENLLKFSDTIIFSTTLHPNPVPNPKSWWYYGLDHGQHISLYSRDTFEFMSKHFGLNYYNIGSLHILSRTRVSKFILLATKFSRLNLDKLVAKLLRSKTWSDHERMTNWEEK
jgi:hypothetical protein